MEDSHLISCWSSFYEVRHSEVSPPVFLTPHCQLPTLALSAYAWSTLRMYWGGGRGSNHIVSLYRVRSKDLINSLSTLLWLTVSHCPSYIKRDEKFKQVGMFNTGTAMCGLDGFLQLPSLPSITEEEWIPNSNNFPYFLTLLKNEYRRALGLMSPHTHTHTGRPGSPPGQSSLWAEVQLGSLQCQWSPAYPSVSPSLGTSACGPSLHTAAPRGQTCVGRRSHRGSAEGWGE